MSELSQAKTGLYVRAAVGLRLRDRKVQRLVQKMRKVMPWLEQADIPTVVVHRTSVEAQKEYV